MPKCPCCGKIMSPFYQFAYQWKLILKPSLFLQQFMRLPLKKIYVCEKCNAKLNITSKTFTRENLSAVILALILGCLFSQRWLRNNILFLLLTALISVIIFLFIIWEYFTEFVKADYNEAEITNKEQATQMTYGIMQIIYIILFVIFCIFCVRAFFILQPFLKSPVLK